DLDGDGCREVFSAHWISGYTFDDTIKLDSKWLLVAANSGKDGRTLWTQLRPVPGDPRPGPLGWGAPGADGRPRLLVPFVNWNIDLGSRGEGTKFGGLMFSPRATFVPQVLQFAAADGNLEHTLPLFEPATADFNQDRLADLYGVQLDETGYFGKLHVF